MILGNAVEDNVKAVSQFYNVDQYILMAEAVIYHNLEGVEMKTANKVIRYLHSNSLCETLPHSSEIAKTLATIPATSSSAERSFPCLRRLKKYLRSTMGQNRLSALGLLCIERGHASRIDINTIIDVFAKRKGRDKMFF